MLLVELTDDGGQKRVLKIADSGDDQTNQNCTLSSLLAAAKSKFRKKFQYILYQDQWIQTDGDLQEVLLVHQQEITSGRSHSPLALVVSNHTPPSDKPFRLKQTQHGIFYVIGDPLSTEDNALTQLRHASELPGVVAAIGMPDLHAGKGIPIGAVVISTQDVAYPQLVDNDIGCGMSFVETSLIRGKLNRNKLASMAKGMESIDGPYASLQFLQEMCGQPAEWGSHELDPLPQLDEYHYANLGTIGGGNHFAELMEFEDIYDLESIKRHGIDSDRVHLLVHSGSRSLGSQYLRMFCDAAAQEEDRPKHGHYAVPTESLLFQEYLDNHNTALNFAARNRKLIAQRFLEQIAAKSDHVCKIDIYHNYLERIHYDSMDAMDAMASAGEGPFPRSIAPLSARQQQQQQQEGATKVGWIHRKGATPTTQSPVLVIPGSRGTLSYLVEVNSQAAHGSAFSLAHGAGRSMPRSKALKLHKERYPDTQQLLQTDLGGVVICEKQELVYEEAPGSYKDIDTVVRCLSQDVCTTDGSGGLVRILATLRPLLTYKYKNPHDHK